MPFTNYASTTLRASAATTGNSEQDTAVTLPETVNEIWVVVDKTAENNADNLLTVRLQSQINSLWYDVAWASMTTTGAVATAADTATDVTRTPNMYDGASDPTFTVKAHFSELPSNVVRVISISSGTGPDTAGTGSTFSVVARFQFNQF